MKLKKYTILLVIAITILFSVTAYADSSWRWISETSTYDVLPFTAVLTLFIETAAINKIPEVNKPLRVFLVITAANLPSFAAPYAIRLTDPIYDFWNILDHTPTYTVGLLYLFITLAVEWPLVRGLLEKYAKKKELLNKTIFRAMLLRQLGLP